MPQSVRTPSPVEPLEVPCDGPWLVASGFASTPRRIATAVAHGLDHDHVHPCGVTARLGECHQGVPHALTLMARRHRDDVQFALRVGGMDPRADETCERFAPHGDPDVVWLAIEERSDIRGRSDLPTLRIEGGVDESRNLIACLLEYRRPGVDEQCEDGFAQSGVTRNDLDVFDDLEAVNLLQHGLPFHDRNQFFAEFRIILAPER